MTPKFLTTKEMAIRERVTQRYIRAEIHRKKIKNVLVIARKHRIPIKEVEAYEKQRTINHHG